MAEERDERPEDPQEEIPDRLEQQDQPRGGGRLGHALYVLAEHAEADHLEEVEGEGEQHEGQRHQEPLVTPNVESCLKTKIGHLEVQLYLYGTRVASQSDVVGRPLALKQGPRRGCHVVEKTLVAIVEGSRGLYGGTRKVDLVRLHVPQPV